MTDKQAEEIRNELLNLEAMARALLENAITLRRKLDGFYHPAPRKGKKGDGLTEEGRMRVAKALARRERFINEAIKRAKEDNSK